MSCGCGCSNLNEGKTIVDHVKSKGKDQFKPNVAHKITCECGESIYIRNCSHELSEMWYDLWCDSM